jgi:hypothetical protein
MKFYRIAAGAIALGMLAGCQTVAPEPSHTYTTMAVTSSQTRAVEAAVRDALKDPNSAMFRHPFQGSTDESGTIFICGFVNARNSFGGYVGDTPFIAGYEPLTGTGVFISMGGTDSETFAVLSVCRNRGIVLS